MAEVEETIYNKNRAILEKYNITINNFETFADQVESFIASFDENIKTSDLKAKDIKDDLDKDIETVKKIDWEGPNIFGDMYKKA